ncbi:MAG: S-methyl-5'-thioadenosine phosphorylase [Candidatus Omnitrophica bacterium]|nr:S-methyl-5'-thioadenosine phosphorylase [Candidatus Omnitrophota bacterium]MBU0881413.1 S-methyl-5'-thioadenosine phosphorylase [Candidatus Omnitrophota bacterium]MBU1809175.1 S-methyl-5'-thioadenosine phosphorylase [Candidatus Omnitrophota bacterium]
MEGKIGIIGGSGLYNMDKIKNANKVSVKTPFGDPSDDYVTGSMDGIDVVFLTRHGKGHRISPSEVNYCANIYGMKKLGVDRIISISACGSLKKELKPLDIVIPDQFVDRTHQARKMTFFRDGIVAHIQFADPICKDIAGALHDAGKKVGGTMHMGGTYLNMEGPQFSTRAESNLYRSWGMDIIGMTNIGEARLAREAEICYATLACVTDYDCWYQSEEQVSIDMIVQNLMKNVDTAKSILATALPKLAHTRTCSCHSALKDAIITDPKMIPVETRKKLELIIGKYIK